MPARSNKTLIYAPEIQVLIATTGEGTLDVSDDIVNWQLRRTVNSASAFSCVLNNRGQKYTGRLGRMDRIVVFLKRFEKLQAFSGYLDSVPGLSRYTTTCEIRATCTLKRLMNTYWDPGLPESQRLLLNQERWDGSANAEGVPFDPSTPAPDRDTDSGLGQMMGNVLIEVAGWKLEDIHIQNIPAGMAELVDDVEENQEAIEVLKKMLGIGGTSSTQTPGTISSAGSAPVIAVELGDYKETFDGSGITAKFTGPFPPGPVIERWRPTAMLAIKLMGIDPSIIDIMMHRIGVESTGNPNAINLVDSNARKGTPSMGILQCIESTFRAFAVPPLTEHIYSPLGSMLASLNYVNTDPKFKGTQIEKFNNAYGGTKGY